MRYLAITLLLSTLACMAQAENDRSSRFACGIRFGSTQLTYSPRAETKSEKVLRAVNPRLQFVSGAARMESLQLAPPEPADFSKTEKRLPPNFTFATVGCSWR